MSRKSIIAILFTLSALLLSCGSKHDHADKMIFHYNESAGITSLDPAFSSSQANIWPCNLLYNGLVDMDTTLAVVPAIAHRWEISPDGLTYTFHLRSDIRFHNTDDYTFPAHRHVTAQDFVYSFNRIVDTAVASPGSWIFQKVARDEHGKYAFKALNDSTLQIKLQEAHPPFLGVLAMKYCSVVPREVVEKYGKDFARHPVGTGPFQMKMWKEGIKLVMRKNPHYFEYDEKGQRLPYLDAVAITFIVDQQSVFMEFMKGSLDFISGNDATYKDALLTKQGELQPQYRDKLQLLSSPYLNTEYIGFLLKDDGSDNPLLKKEVRQALNYGFDREKMMRYLRNGVGYAGTSGFVPRGMPSFDEHRVKGYHFDPDKATALLVRAGYPNGKGLPPITISVTAQYMDLCQYIQHELSQIGITVKLDVGQASQLNQMKRTYRLPAFRASWICDYPDAENYLSLFYSKNLQPNGSNYTHYVNPKFDALFEKSQRVLDDAQRNEYYKQLDSMLMEDAPVMVLYYDKVSRFVQKNVEGMEPGPTNLLDLRRVRIVK